MQHEAAIDLHRTAEMDGRRAQRVVVERHVDLLEQRRERHVDRLVHHDAERAVLVVLAHEGERVREVRIGHGRHGDQEVMGEIHVVVVARCRPIVDAPDGLAHNCNGGDIPHNDAQQRWFPCPVPPYERALVWFRRDLRNFDHAALHARAVVRRRRVHARSCSTARSSIRSRARTAASSSSATAWRSSMRRLAPERRRTDRRCTARRAKRSRSSRASSTSQAVFVNRDYEPQAIARDRDVASRARATAGIAYHDFKDQVDLRARRDRRAVGPALLGVHAVPQRVARRAARPLTCARIARRATAGALRAAAAVAAPVPSLRGRLGSTSRICARPASSRAWKAVPRCSRNFASASTTTRRRAISRRRRRRRDCRFTCASARCPSASSQRSRTRARCEPGGDGAHTWLSELIWREFFAQVLWHRPDVVDHSFPRRIRRPPFRQRSATCSTHGARAAPAIRSSMPRMRELNATGYMHNRLRMVAASLPRQGPAVRLALGRALFRRQAHRLRPRVEQRQLAVGGVDRMRRATVLPHLQSGHAVASDSIPTARTSGGSFPSFGALDRRLDPRAVEGLRWMSSAHKAWSSDAITRRRSWTTLPARRARDVQGRAGNRGRRPTLAPPEGSERQPRASGVI